MCLCIYIRHRIVSSGSSKQRRGFLISGGCMASGLIASYGTLGWMSAKFLYPLENDMVQWQYVTPISEINLGQAWEYESPSGAKVVVARQSTGVTADCFIALSGTCPHLGCQVHWEGHNDRFFCPCHNGVFDPTGQPISGPPAAANQPLTQYRVKVEEKLLFALVPVKSITARG